MNLTYLKELTNKLNNYVTKHNSFNDLYNALMDDKFSLFKKYDYEETMNELNIYKDVINKIISIIYKPHIKSIKEETLIRSEVSSSLSTSSFLNTLKDIKLWKNKDNKLTPEYVYNEINIDTIDTYENRFISLLIDYLDINIIEISLSITPLIESIEDIYEISGFNFGRNSIINDLVNNYDYTINDLFIKEEGNKNKVYKLTKSLIKKVKHLKGSNFYKVTSKKLNNKNILPTNILLHDPLYNYCYKFYKESYLDLIKLDSYKELDIYYYNYVLVSFINKLVKLNIGKTSINKKEVLYFDDNNRLSFNKLSFKKKLFSFIITMNKDNLSFNIETRLINKAIRSDTKVNNTYKSNSYILTSFYLNNINNEEINNILINNKDKYINEYIFTMNNLIGEYKNVINLSYYKKDNELKINNFINSLMLLFDCDLELIKDRCPICKESNISYDGFNYRCNNCKATYSINNIINNKEVMWLKSGRR